MELYKDAGFTYHLRDTQYLLGGDQGGRHVPNGLDLQEEAVEGDVARMSDEGESTKTHPGWEVTEGGVNLSTSTTVRR